MKGTLLKRQNAKTGYRIKYTDGTEETQNIDSIGLRLLLEDERKRRNSDAENVAFISGYVRV